MLNNNKWFMCHCNMNIYVSPKRFRFTLRNVIIIWMRDKRVGAKRILDDLTGKRECT